jgi:hypothetical protein
METARAAVRGHAEDMPDLGATPNFAAFIILVIFIIIHFLNTLAVFISDELGRTAISITAISP